MRGRSDDAVDVSAHRPAVATPPSPVNPSCPKGHAAATIRSLAKDDLDPIMRIESNSFSSPWPRSAFDLALSATAISCLVAVRSESVCGYLIGCHQGSTILVANLAVHPHHRRRGVASQLLGAAIEMAGQQGATRCRLEVRISNRAAIDLYRKHQFRPVAVQPSYYSSPAEDALTMMRDVVSLSER